MKEGVVYSNSNIEVCYNPDLCVTRLWIVGGSNTENISIDGKLKYIRVSKPSNTLLFLFLDIAPRVFDCKQRKLFKVRHADGCIYLVQDKLLVNTYKTIPWVWMQKGAEYIRLKHCEDYPEPDSFGYQRNRNGNECLIINNEVIQIKPETIIDVYPVNQHDLQLYKQEDDKISSIKQDAVHSEILSPAKLQEKADKEHFKIAKSASGNIWILYSLKYSSFWVWKKKAGMMSFLEVRDGHSCSIYCTSFLGDDVYFATLDSVGTIKIWQLDDYIIYCCQTLKKEDLHEQHSYRSIEYNADDNKLLCTYDNCIDYYTVRADTYKAKRKNNLLLFDRTIETNKKTSLETKHYDSPHSIHNMVNYHSKAQDVAYLKINHDKEKNVNRQQGYEYSELSEIIRKEQISGTSQVSTLFIKKEITVYVGIDFGTSRTKICYQTARDKTPHVLHFNSMRGKSNCEGYETWSMPSIVVKKGNQLYFGVEALSQIDGSRFDRLKTSLFEKSLKDSDVLMAASYLAYLFCTARDMIKRELNLKDKCSFVYSVCLPVEKMNNNIIVEIFNKVLVLAEYLADDNCFSDFEISAAKNNDVAKRGVHKRRFSEIIPESAAEIVDFHKRLSEPGVYALYDFGAGTTDLTVFSLNRNQSTIHSDMLGAKIVYRGFMDIEAEVNSSDTPDTIIRDHYQKIFDDFINSGVWHDCKQKRIGDESMKPFHDMKILASGGASNSSIILDVFKKTPFHDIVKNHSIQQLKNPPSWSLDAPYHRCAVAYGLSQDPEYIIKHYKLPKDCQVVEYKHKRKEYTEDEILENNRKWN